MCATPHSQRSYANVRVATDPRAHPLPIPNLIEAVETAVDTAQVLLESNDNCCVRPHSEGAGAE